jgi:hypothetical protein
MTEIKKDLRIGNQFAKKETPATAMIHIRCAPSEKNKWVKAAQVSGGLSAWVTDILNKNS